jgi:hypothetical protein
MCNLKKIVKEVIRKECRKEALEILKLSSQEDVDKFIEYYEDDNFNICCLHLDFLKEKLVKAKKMKEDGCFGNPFSKK